MSGDVCPECSADLDVVPARHLPECPYFEARLDTTFREKVNDALWNAGLDGTQYFPSLSAALTTIERVLHTHGIVVTDPAFYSADTYAFFPPPRNFDVTLDPEVQAAFGALGGEVDADKDIGNSLLTVSWYELEDAGSWEVTARLT